MFILLLIFFFNSYSMDNLLAGKFTPNSWEKPFFESMLTHIGDQAHGETKFENFKTLMRCRRVNTSWKAYVDDEYKKQFAKEKELVQKNAQEEFAALQLVKPIQHLKYHDEKQRNIDIELGYEIKHELLACLLLRRNHDKFLLDSALYSVGHFVATHESIFPIAWAVFTGASASEKLLAAFFEGDSYFYYRYQQALKNKDKFNEPIKTYIIISEDGSTGWVAGYL